MGLGTVPPAPYAIYAAPDARQVPLRWLQSFGASSYNVMRPPPTAARMPPSPR